MPRRTCERDGCNNPMWPHDADNWIIARDDWRLVVCSNECSNAIAKEYSETQEENMTTSDTVKSGVELITAERQRQIEVEGWTPEHDDKHRWGELAKAAACYAVHDTDAEVVEGDESAWPWSKEWDKRKTGDIRNLVKAGALIAAEIDRVQRRHPGRQV